MDIVNGYLLPVGFKELIECLNSQNSKMVQAKDIQKTLTLKYGFSSGKVAGTIKRAEEKGLLSKIGYGVYQYNAEKTKEYQISSLPKKNTAESKATSAAATPTEPKIQNALTKANDEIMRAVKRINEIPAPELTSLSIDDFQKLKEKISDLVKLAER